MLLREIESSPVPGLKKEALDAGLSGRFRADYRKMARSSTRHPFSIRRNWQTSMACYRRHWKGALRVIMIVRVLVSFTEQSAYH